MKSNPRRWCGSLDAMWVPPSKDKVDTDMTIEAARDLKFPYMDKKIAYPDPRSTSSSSRNTENFPLNAKVVDTVTT